MSLICGERAVSKETHILTSVACTLSTVVAILSVWYKLCFSTNRLKEGLEKFGECGGGIIFAGKSRTASVSKSAEIGDQPTTANEHARSGELRIAMDADHWFTAYKRYKSGTTKFTTWLTEAVQHCGRSLADITQVSAPSPAPFPKAAEKKAGKAAVNASTQIKHSKYLVPIKDFTKLAQVVVNSTKQKIQVPPSILPLLDDIISLRKEYSHWVGQAAGGSQAQYETHLHFVSVLQQVKAILQRSERAVPKGSGPVGKENTDPRGKEAANIFEALSLEEPTGAVDSPDSSFSVSTRPNANVKATSKPIYDMELLHDEVLFSSVLFFQDLEAIRRLIRKTWSEYRGGRTELSTASLLTNTAIEIIQRSTKEHLDSIKRWSDAPEEKDFIFWFYTHICKEAITDGEKPGDYTHMKTYEQAERISWPFPSSLKRTCQLSRPVR